MIDTVTMHTPTYVPEQTFTDVVMSSVRNAANAAGDTIGGAYSWLKGEVKGAADYTTTKANSLLFTVAIAGTVVLLLYLVFKKEVTR